MMGLVYNSGMKRTWRTSDPAKRPPSESTMKMEADFGQFKKLMTRIVSKKPEGEPKPASPASAASAS
jgi:hypothetical protein